MAKSVKKIAEEKTTKREMVITNEGVQKCSHCNGEGYMTTKNGKKTKCSYCDGAGYTYNKPAKAYSRNVVAFPQVKKVKTKKAETKKTTKKVAEPVRQAEPLNFEDMKYSFTHENIKYVASNTAIIKENLTGSKDIKRNEVENQVEKILKIYFKALNVKTLEDIITEKKGVLGVRYAVRKELPLVDLTGKTLDTKDYSQSALKLSKETWIDIRYAEVFKNHRFIYLNPIKGKLIPVLCINKNTHKLDGVIMPLALS